jgi:hypothetical protein
MRRRAGWNNAATARSTGRDCIMLDGVVCTADYGQYCPHGTYPYWYRREIWLRRVEAPSG